MYYITLQPTLYFAGISPGFCSMKQVQVFLPHPGLQGYPDHYFFLTTKSKAIERKQHDNRDQLQALDQ